MEKKEEEEEKEKEEREEEDEEEYTFLHFILRSFVLNWGKGLIFYLFSYKFSIDINYLMD